MKPRTRFLFAVIVGGLFIVGVIVFPAVWIWRPDKRTETIVRISNCYAYARSVRQSLGQQEFIRRLETGKTPQERFERLGKMLDVQGDGKKNLVDGWGRPMLLDVDPKTQNIVIWSAGPNGMNENRSGDDVSIEDDAASGP